MDEEIDEEIYFGWYAVEGNWNSFDIWLQMQIGVKKIVNLM